MHRSSRAYTIPALSNSRSSRAAVMVDPCEGRGDTAGPGGRRAAASVHDGSVADIRWRLCVANGAERDGRHLGGHAGARCPGPGCHAPPRRQRCRPDRQPALLGPERSVAGLPGRDTDPGHRRQALRERLAGHRRPSLGTPGLGLSFSGSFFSAARRRTVGYTIAYLPGHGHADNLPLVIALHGYGGNHARALADMSPGKRGRLRLGASVRRGRRRHPRRGTGPPAGAGGVGL